ncbi:Alpha-n-acetylglucosaminidase [Thalictrum thalictroides]|uniref:Alpha-n-acetylglucosaminidase n=1 Tax=Thalictrum thalictroides TaxID=46969 RepID=A0A7J6VKA5_THATH|nr:Alpha-n-acetylglucosaminidase [Thalictrum thalictroides]
MMASSQDGVDWGRTCAGCKEWLKSYSYRRYGKEVLQIDSAWEILHRTIYNCTDGIADHNKDFIVQFPDWDPSEYFHTNMSKESHVQGIVAHNNTKRFFLRETTTDLPRAHLWYSTEEVIVALQLFLDAGNHLAGSLTYRYDLVDLMRQVLSKLANQVYLDAMTAFQQKNVKALTLQSLKFVELIKDVDMLLASDDNFLLGTWIESSKKLAVSPREMRQYEWNARTQVTMWYDTTKTNQSKLHDYANKFWSGLLEKYYFPRASTYFTYLLESVVQKEGFKLEEWRREWISYSNKWQSGTELYPVRAQGDALAISKALFKKYLL